MGSDYTLTRLRPSKPALSPVEWKLTALDKACASMVIKGVWFYSSQLDEKKLQQALCELLNSYPTLCGQLKENKKEGSIVCNALDVPFYTVDFSELTIDDVKELSNPLDQYPPMYDVDDFRKGLVAPLQVSLVHLADGCAVSVQCAHACLDGYAFYTFVDNLGKVCRGEEPAVPLLDPALLPTRTMTRWKTVKEVRKEVKDGIWYHIGFRQMLRLIKFGKQQPNQKDTFTWILSESQIVKLKEVMTHCLDPVGTHAMITALLFRMITRLSARPQCYSIVTVANLRGRFRSLPSNYMGNAVGNLERPNLSPSQCMMEIAEYVQGRLNYHFDKDERNIDSFVELYFNVLNYRLPYVPFDVMEMNCEEPFVIYVNNLLSFPIYQVDFGCGKPVAALPNDLEDMIKLWPSANGKDIQVCLTGYAARLFAQAQDLEGLMDELLKYEERFFCDDKEEEKGK